MAKAQRMLNVGSLATSEEVADSLSVSTTDLKIGRCLSNTNTTPVLERVESMIQGQSGIA